jgi:hypothetical protein
MQPYVGTTAPAVAADDAHTLKSNAASFGTTELSEHRAGARGAPPSTRDYSQSLRNGGTQEDGTRAHRLAGTSVDDNMADPDRIAETYLQLHRQHRSTWAFEVVLRPWLEEW